MSPYEKRLRDGLAAAKKAYFAARSEALYVAAAGDADEYEADLIVSILTFEEVASVIEAMLLLDDLEAQRKVILGILSN